MEVGDLGGEHGFGEGRVCYFDSHDGWTVNVTVRLKFCVAFRCLLVEDWCE